MLLLLLPLLFMTCKSYYNDTIDWMDNIEHGMSIEEVKSSQPDFLEVNWEKPDTLDHQLLFEIEKIKGNNDILNMSHYLIFVDGEYNGRISRK